MERITVTPPNAGQNTVRLTPKASGSGSDDDDPPELRVAIWTPYNDLY
ncbi:hypothetical protein [Amycolatopsis kentuckyensis]